jgi:hypothetical protein
MDTNQVEKEVQYENFFNSRYFIIDLGSHGDIKTNSCSLLIQHRREEHRSIV